MLQSHECDDLAPAAQVTRRIEFLCEAREIQSAASVQDLGMVALMADCISQMMHIGVRSGHIPPAPSIVKARAMVRKVLRSTKGRHAIGVWKHRCDHDAGNTEGARAF